ncbi:SdpI family protein [Devosia neptuniae]|uniref:SdpI family protein n=1 Tax=Devosia neptuniae TaxID=191302 RepID=A0ABY6CD46_9HYPH|nr:SdpI family protein [Devosia neptuniae]UXN69743.1 SdpI family protein [Devosia neptuniae]
MQRLVTRFHLLLLAVTIAITGVGFLRVPADFAYPAHWSGSYADWLWPRDLALPVAPLIEVLILAAFFLLGRLLSKNHFAKVQHILDPALTLLLAVVTAIQLGLLVIGIGSDIDLVRLTGAGLGIVLLILGIVFFEAERHTYAGLRMPWPIVSDRAWKLVHRIVGIACGLTGAVLLALAWFDPGLGLLITAYAVTLVLLPAIAGLATILCRRL